MKDYPTREGKHGLIYDIATGVRVSSSVDGTWEVSVKYQGFRDRKRFGKDLEKAVKYGELVAAKLGITPKPPGECLAQYTVEQAAQDWMAGNRARWKPNTLERYSGLVRDFVLPALGQKPLEKVDRNAVKDLLVDTLAIRSAKHVEVLHCVISGIFGEAIDRGRVNENPASGLAHKVLPAKRKRNESLPDPFSRDDLQKVMDAARIHCRPTVALVLETLAYTGMRLGECLAMHRDNLDVGNSQYMVKETIRNGRFGEPKTGRRLIDLMEENARSLESHILKLRREAMSQGGEIGYLFPAFTQRVIQRALQRACRTARVRIRSPHDLRHTYATLLLMDHYSPAYVQKQLGHHSITMTVDVYGHWIPGEGRKDLQKTLTGGKSADLGLAQKNRAKVKADASN
jgi:integrase